MSTSGKLQNFIFQINSIKQSYFQDCPQINLAQFSKCFFTFSILLTWTHYLKVLREIEQFDSTLEVTEENTAEIFNMLDYDHDGYLTFSEIDQLLTTILPAYEESLSPAQGEEPTSNRGSLYFDVSQKRFTYARTKQPGGDKRKIGSAILNTLSLDKMSELKYIYQMADRENKGFAEIERIRSSKGSFEIKNSKVLTSRWGNGKSAVDESIRNWDLFFCFLGWGYK